jgi:hypothetical protein
MVERKKGKGGRVDGLPRKRFPTTFGGGEERQRQRRRDGGAREQRSRQAAAGALFLYTI